MLGTTLGHFRIQEKLGEGGMGVVYKAHDTKLDRTVAIKILQPNVFRNEESRQRFIREARTPSALNHPHIVTIHAIEADHEPNYIVMEFVDGQPLNELIPAKGMRWSEALRIALQIADALSAAHAARIVHRDLKPANIMVTRQGSVKLLDFGLAKPLVATSISEDDATVPNAPATMQGVLLGSVPYMSPEQAQGLPVDERSDIFSFGAVLYEMVSGRRPFAGKTMVETLSQIVQLEPSALEGVPTELERLVMRCLRKDLNRRSQHMSDVKLVLEELRDDSESGRLSAPSAAMPVLPAPRRRWLWPAIAAGSAGIAIAAVAWSLSHRSPSAPPVPQLTRISPDDGYNYKSAAISADGRLIAYISDRSGADQVWLQQVGGAAPIQITHKDRVTDVSFFPDGTQLLVLTDAGDSHQSSMEIVPALGGQPRTLMAGHVHAPRLSPDGRQVAYFDERSPEGLRVWVLPTEGGAPRLLEKYPLVGMIRGRPLAWMPDGQSVIFLGMTKPDATSLDQWDWFVLPLNGGVPTPMGAGDILRRAGLSLALPIAWGEWLLFSSGPNADRRNIWRIHLDPSSGKVDGIPQQLTFGTGGEAPRSMSAAGMAAVINGNGTRDFYLMPTDPATGQATGPARRLTRDGRPKQIWFVGGDPASLYFFVSQGGAQRRALTIYSLDLTTSDQKVIDSPMEFFPNHTVSGDGKKVAYSRSDGNSWSIYLKDAGAASVSGSPACVKCGRPQRFSPDGKYLIVDAEATVKRSPRRKHRLALMELATGKLTPWLEDRTESIFAHSQFDKEWFTITTRPPGGEGEERRFALLWRPTPIPREEWIEVPPLRLAHFAPTTPFVYGFRDSEFVASRLDAKQRRFSEWFPVKLPPGSVQLRKDDVWSLSGPGITFQRQQVQSSVWLLKLPN